MAKFRTLTEFATAGGRARAETADYSKMGKKGAKARLTKLSPEKRREIARIASAAAKEKRAERNKAAQKRNKER